MDNINVCAPKQHSTKERQDGRQKKEKKKKSQLLVS